MQLLTQAWHPVTMQAAPAEQPIQAVPAPQTDPSGKFLYATKASPATWWCTLHHSWCAQQTQREGRALSCRCAEACPVPCLCVLCLVLCIS